MTETTSIRDWGIVAGPTVSVVVAAVGVVGLLIKFSEQYGLGAKRKKELELTKARLVILSGEALEAEKSRTK